MRDLRLREAEKIKKSVDAMIDSTKLDMRQK